MVPASQREQSEGIPTTAVAENEEHTVAVPRVAKRTGLDQPDSERRLP
jgi:hypothetical protein